MTEILCPYYKGYEVLWDGLGIYVLHELFPPFQLWQLVDNIDVLKMHMANKHQVEYLSILDILKDTPND
jgi:hypothetical protein